MKPDTVQLGSLGFAVLFFIFACLLRSVNTQSYHWSNGWKPGKRSQPANQHSYSPDLDLNQRSYLSSDSYSSSGTSLRDKLYVRDARSRQAELKPHPRQHNDHDASYETLGYLKQENVKQNALFDSLFSQILSDSSFNQNLYNAILSNSELEKEKIPDSRITDDMLMTPREYEGLYKLVTSLVDSWGEDNRSCQFSSATGEFLLLLIQEEIGRMRTCDALRKFDQLAGRSL